MLGGYQPWGNVALESMGNATIVETAQHAGLFAINPSDLVFESNDFGIAYYDYVLSAATSSNNNWIVYLAKLDTKTNIESLETAVIPKDLLVKNDIPNTDLSLCTMGMLLWKKFLQNRRVLCLVQVAEPDCVAGLEAVRKAAKKMHCSHHVLTIGNNNGNLDQSTKENHQQNDVNKSVANNRKGMGLRLMMCQTRSCVLNLPNQTIRETKYLIAPEKNPLLCLCVMVP